MPLSLDAALRSDFIGLDTCYPRADGGCSRRVYLDSAASTLALGCARQLTDALLRHYANTHSSVHFSARIASAALDWARAQMLDFVHADPERHTALFIGNGCTEVAGGLLDACGPDMHGFCDWTDCLRAISCGGLTLLCTFPCNPNARSSC